MNVNQSTIWINVTTSAAWKRPPVGIVRVERALSSELGKLYGERFKHCIWQDDRFIEWSPKDEKDTPPLDRQNSKTTSVVAPAFPILPKKEAMAALGQGLLSLTPKRLQPLFNSLLLAMRPRLGRMLSSNVMQRLTTKLRRRAAMSSSKKLLHMHSSRDAETGAIFKPGDVLISVGLDWNYSYFNSFYSLRKKSGVRVITCCYDLIPVLYPQYCVNDVAQSFTAYFLEIADGSDLILCISRQTEKDLAELLDRTGAAHPPTHVFPLGDTIPAIGNNALSTEVEKLCQTPFILFVSTIERRKNHEVLYRAYHILCQQGNREKLPKLVFVGMKGWGVNELLKDIELDPMTQGLIVQLNQVSDSELHALYEAARFCVFPSLYEGWGLPVGEALSLGKVVIASNRGSLPEVGGDIVTYADPWCPQAWAELILRLSTHDEVLKSQEATVRANYRPRRWEDAALSIKCKIDNLYAHSRETTTQPPKHKPQPDRKWR